MATDTTTTGLIGRATGAGAVLRLEKENSHARDKYVRFEEEPHLYYIKDPATGVERQVSVSVTGLVGAKTSKFDADSAIDAMKRSTKKPWPTDKYMVPFNAETRAAHNAAYEAFKEAVASGATTAPAHVSGMDLAQLQARAKAVGDPPVVHRVFSDPYVEMTHDSEGGCSLGCMKPCADAATRRAHAAAMMSSEAWDKTLRFQYQVWSRDVRGLVDPTISDVLRIWGHRIPVDTREEAEAVWAADTGVVYGETPEAIVVDGRRVMTDAEIKRSWSDNGNTQSALGTNMHAQLELYANDAFDPEKDIDETCPSAPDTRMGIAWLAKVKAEKGWTPWRTEWIVYDEDTDVAGSIDLVMQDADGALHIVDYKRCDTTKAGFDKHFGRMMEAPLQRVPDCTLSKWMLQANAYRHMIESKYGKVVKTMRMAVFRTDKEPEPREVVLERSDVVLKLFQENRDRLEAMRAVSAATAEAEAEEAGGGGAGSSKRVRVK